MFLLPVQTIAAVIVSQDIRSRHPCLLLLALTYLRVPPYICVRETRKRAPSDGIAFHINILTS